MESENVKDESLLTKCTNKIFEYGQAISEGWNETGDEEKIDDTVDGKPLPTPEELKDKPSVELVPVPFDEKDKKRAVYLEYAKNENAIRIALIVGISICLLLFLIPVLGWILGGVGICVFFPALFSPVGWWIRQQKKSSPDEYKIKEDIALARLSNRFVNVSCPGCGHIEPTLQFEPGQRKHVCSGCKANLVRAGNSLYLYN